MKLSWDESTDNDYVNGYSIYRNNVLIGTTQDTYYDDENIPAGLYKYQVRAFDDSDNVSELSNAVTYDNLSPSAPSNLVASSKTDTLVNLNWSASSDNNSVSGYKVFCNESEIGSVTVTNYTYGIKSDDNYSFYIIAFDVDGNESDKSNVLVLENEPPEKPSDLKVTLRKHDSLTISWSEAKDNVGVTKYQIFVNSNLVGETDKTTYTLTNLIYDSTYTISVRAVDASANVSEESLVSVKTLIQPVYLNSNLTLNENRVYGDLYIQSGTIDLNGYRLTVEGNLYQSGGTLYINGGELYVSGNYRIDNGSGGYTSAIFKMVNEADYVKIGGDFNTYSYKSHKEHLTAGTMEVKGNFTQRYTNGVNSEMNFQASGTHKVILSGEGLQKVNFQSPWSSCFNILELSNYSEEGIVFESVLPIRELKVNGCKTNAIRIGIIGWTLTDDTIIRSDIYISGPVDLNGYKLKVEGNVIQTGGTLYINRGELHVCKRQTQKDLANIYQASYCLTIFQKP